MSKQPSRRRAARRAGVKSPLENGHVMLGAIHGHMVHAKWFAWIMRVLWYDVHNSQRLIPNGGWIDLESSPRIASSRNMVIREFLNAPSNPEWLWMVDTDMVGPPDVVDLLVNTADWRERPVIGGLCFAGSPDGKHVPTIYKFGNQHLGEPLMIRLDEYPKDALCKVEGTGAACVLMHRAALETVYEKWQHSAYPWFAETEHAGKEFGEDVSLMVKFNGCGVPVHVDTRIKIGHIKESILDESTYEKYREQVPVQAEVQSGVSPAERQARELGLVA